MGSSVYEIVTGTIVKRLEEGNIPPWQKPWSCSFPKNVISGKEYRGINTLLLMTSPFDTPVWGTFNQWKQLGGSVKKGERSEIVTYWGGKYTKTVKGEGGEEEKKGMPAFLRYYRVFNVQQIQFEGGVVPPKVEKQLVVKKALGRKDTLKKCKEIVVGMPNPPKITLGGVAAYYSVGLDIVNIPPKDTFDKLESYYGTLFHELIHSTGHKSRLERDIAKGTNKFGSPDYSKEELIAEIGACFLCGIAGIFPVVQDNSTSYLASWASKLSGDPKLIVTASSAGQKAADYIINEEKEEEVIEEE